LEGGSLKRGGKESLRAQVNHLRGRVAELRRFPVRQDSEVGWLADPEAQEQVAEVGLFSFLLFLLRLRRGKVLIFRFLDNIN
jgi:hypothetical protein